MKTPVILSASSIALLLTMASSASMAQSNSGFVEGRIEFFSNQSEYCNQNSAFGPVRDCTGALVTDAHVRTFRPIVGALIEVRGPSNNVIGSGVTDGNGDFFIRWSTSGSFNPNRINWIAKNGAFRVVDPNDNDTTFLVRNDISLFAGGTTVHTGTIQYGNSANPNPLINLYDSLWKSWENVLQHSSKISSRIGNPPVRARAFNATACFGTSNPFNACTSATQKIITFGGPSIAFELINGAPHEMGHIASTLSQPGIKKASRDPAGQAYCAEGEATPCGWTYTPNPRGATPPFLREFTGTSFEEGFASFHAVATVYGFQATQPVICDRFTTAGSPCQNDAFTYNVEDAPGFNGSFCGDAFNWPLTVIRYLWDIFDNRQDSNIGAVNNCNGFTGGLTDQESHAYFKIIDTMDGYGTGTGNHERDEPWTSDRSAIDGHHGRNHKDFWWNFANNSLGPHVDTWRLLCMDCVDPSVADPIPPPWPVP